jgi:hypothetical protein
LSTISAEWSPIAMRSCRLCLSIAACLPLLVTGCANTNHTTNGAAIGAGLGTLTGAIVGHQSGKGAEGALIGAAAGALGGGLIGNAKDERERADSWQSYANHVDRVQVQQQRAMSAQDIVEMSKTPGLDDQIIIQAIQSRGLNFAADKDNLVFLANNQVNSTVIRAVQTYSAN